MSVQGGRRGLQDRERQGPGSLSLSVSRVGACALPLGRVGLSLGVDVETGIMALRGLDMAMVCRAPRDVPLLLLRLSVWVSP